MTPSGLCPESKSVLAGPRSVVMHKLKCMMSITRETAKLLAMPSILHQVIDKLPSTLFCLPRREMVSWVPPTNWTTAPQGNWSRCLQREGSPRSSN